MWMPYVYGKKKKTRDVFTVKVYTLFIGICGKGRWDTCFFFSVVQACIIYFKGSF